LGRGKGDLKGTPPRLQEPISLKEIFFLTTIKFWAPPKLDFFSFEFPRRASLWKPPLFPLSEKGKRVS